MPLRSTALRRTWCSSWAPACYVFGHGRAPRFARRATVRIDIDPLESRDAAGEVGIVGVRGRSGAIDGRCGEQVSAGKYRAWRDRWPSSGGQAVKFRADRDRSGADPSLRLCKEIRLPSARRHPAVDGQEIT
jgi:hypothetical protein